MTDFTYYGRMEGKPKGETLMVYAVDQAFKRVVKKNSELFREEQKVVIEELKECFKDEIKAFNKKISNLLDKIKTLEEETNKHLVVIRAKLEEHSKSKSINKEC